MQSYRGVKGPNTEVKQVSLSLLIPGN